MARDHRRSGQSYDEIVRRTVPEPDSSFRPTLEQERAAYEGTRILSDDEQRLYARVSDALIDLSGIDLATLAIEIDRTTVVLRGRVAEPPLLTTIEQHVAAVDGVTEVRNELVVGP